MGNGYQKLREVIIERKYHYKKRALIGVLFGLVSAKFSCGMTLRRFGKTPKNMLWESGTSALFKTLCRGQNVSNKIHEK